MMLDHACREAVDNEWHTSREIWIRHGYGAEVTTSRHLKTLADLGEIEQNIKPLSNGGYAYLYRKKQPHADSPGE